ncbi:MAG: hypothetical protein ACYC3X_13030 [Pirellulaceae bacterium]
MAMAVGQQLQCRVCQTVFFAPVIAPEQPALPPPPVSGPSASPASGGDNLRDTRRQVPIPPSVGRPPAGATPSRSWRTEEDEPAALAQTSAAAPRDSGRLSSAHADPASRTPSEDAPAGGRVWTVITVIAGLLILTTSLLIGVLWLRDQQQAPSSSSANQSPGSGTTPRRAAPSVSRTPVLWSDAVLHAQRLGLLEVKVLRVKYGAVRAKNLNNEVITTDETSLLAITVSVHNRGAAKCEFRSWYAGGFEAADGQELLPELSDDLERTYSLLRFDDVSSIEGQRLADEVEAHQVVQDTVVFQVPADLDRSSIRFFHLSLPAHAIGTEDFFRFEIPVRMIDGFLKAQAKAGAEEESKVEAKAETGTE